MSGEAEIERRGVRWGGSSYLDAMAIKCNSWEILGAKEWVRRWFFMGL